MPAAIASVGMSSTADRQRTYQSRSAGLHGARAKPQLLITTDVTPCQHEQLPSGSQAIWASMWVWPSMKPGETISPSASMVRVAAVVTLPISTIRPSLMPTSPEKRRLPEPSTIVPPRMIRSSAILPSRLFGDPRPHPEEAAQRPSRRAGTSTVPCCPSSRGDYSAVFETHAFGALLRMRIFGSQSVLVFDDLPVGVLGADLAAAEGV